VRVFRAKNNVFGNGEWVNWFEKKSFAKVMLYPHSVVSDCSKNAQKQIFPPHPQMDVAHSTLSSFPAF